MVEVKSAVTEHTVSSETLGETATGSVEEALGRDAGAAKREGETFVRGGRSGQANMQIDGVARPGTAIRRSHGQRFGHRRPEEPQRRSLRADVLRAHGHQPVRGDRGRLAVDLRLDVDNASWTMARNYLERGVLPPKDAIRVEEFVNAFDPGWSTHTDEAFRIHTDGGASRFGDGYHLLRIGLVGKTVDDAESQTRQPCLRNRRLGVHGHGKPSGCGEKGPPDPAR